MLGSRCSSAPAWARTAAAMFLSVAPAGLLATAAHAVPLFATAYLSFDTGGRPFSVATGDLNHDGLSDLVVANQSTSSLTVLLGAGDGTLPVRADFLTGTSPISVALADLNGDGKLDAVTANLDANTVSVLIGFGEGAGAVAEGAEAVVCRRN